MACEQTNDIRRVHLFFRGHSGNQSLPQMHVLAYGQQGQTARLQRESYWTCEWTCDISRNFPAIGNNRPAKLMFAPFLREKLVYKRTENPGLQQVRG
jgi:hypothetical protein